MCIGGEKPQGGLWGDMGQEQAAALGARCDECVLKSKGIHTPSVVLTGAVLDVVTDYPRRAPMRPLIAAAEAVLAEASRESRLNVLPAVACAPAKGHLEDVLNDLAQENRRLVKAGAKPRPGPVECCRPRLLKELKVGTVLTMGPEAYQSVTGQVAEVMEVRGAPVEIGGLRVLPTVHPMQKQPAWRRAFRSDVRKAIRWAEEGLCWPKAKMTANPAPEVLSAFLEGPGPFAVDVETTREDPLTSRLKCLGIATVNEAMLVQWLSVEGPGGRLVEAGYTEAERAEVERVLRAFLVDELRLKVGHNAVAFDAVVLKGHLGVEMSPLLDTMLLHRAVDPEAPHNLGFVGSIYTDAPAWKAEHTGSDARSDAELAAYCMTDCVVTARAVEPLVDEADGVGLGACVAHDHRVQRVYRQMRETGLPVAGLEAECRRLEAENRRLEWELKKRGVDPGSPSQLRRLLFEEWGLVPRRVTSTGLPALDVAALRLLRRGMDSDRAETVDLLLSRARVRASWRALSDIRVEDGRVRPEWSVRADAWTPDLGRFVKAPEGKVLVTGRLLQPRLRLVTAEASLGVYAEAFRASTDPHIETAVLMLGEAMRGLTGEKRQKIRRLAYDVLEAVLYGAQDEQVFDTVTLLEEADGTLRYPRLTLREVSTMRRAWVSAAPEISRWWDGQGQMMREAGAAVDPVLGRRLPDSGGPEGLRWRIEQGAAALVQQALLRAAEAGLVLVAHAGDMLVAEADVDEEERATWLMRQACAGEVSGVKLAAQVLSGSVVERA